MQLIIFIIFILLLVFGKWAGIPFKWLLTKIVSDPYGAIIVTFLLILAIIRLFKIFVGETQMPPISFPKFKKKTKTKTKTKD